MRWHLSLILFLLLSAVGCDFGGPDLVEPTVALDMTAPVVPQLAALVAQGAIPEADVNRDGLVDIRDLILVAQSFGQQVDAPASPVDVLDAQLRTTEKNTVFWREAWRVALRNNTADTVSVDLVVQLQDADGFVVDDDTEYGLVLSAGEETTFAGFDLLSVPWVEAVAQLRASVTVADYVQPAGEAATGDIELVDLAVRVTEQNTVFWRFAWRLTARNATDGPLTFDATIDMQDGDGFIVDTDTAYGLTLAGGATETFAGFALVTADVADTIQLYDAHIR
ncbi:MAG: hypothetical protein ABGY41_04335 [Candidatus Poribacteria bacterium]